MFNEDTVRLLRECDAGAKTAVNCINEVIGRAQSKKLYDLLMKNTKLHEEIGNEIGSLLDECAQEEKDPALMSRIMSWVTINAKMLNSPTDSTIAGLMTDGCAMGIKSVSEYENRFPLASDEAKGKAEKLVRLQQDFMDDLREFL